MKIGVIGCGNISPAYLGLGKTFDVLQIAACADLDLERARARAAEFAIPRASTVEELLADPSIELVINLTTPQGHGPVGMQVLNAGKHLYNEKPLAIDLTEARRLLDDAERSGLRVGGAPDTFFGAGLQTCRKLIDDGTIGKPMAATAFMLNHGHESWHPDPAFYYQQGGGPMFDMGPYYLTALVMMLGPVRRVTASTRISFPERTITSEPRRGTAIQVQVPTHIAGIMDFATGAIGTIVTSFDVWAAEVPRIEIYGSEGTLSVPDPNTFGGAVRLRHAGEKEWRDVPFTHGYDKGPRGLGVADMVYALGSGRPHRASGELAYHVLEIMHAFHTASDEGRHVMIESSSEQPAALPLGLRHGTLDA